MIYLSLTSAAIYLVLERGYATRATLSLHDKDFSDANEAISGAGLRGQQ